MEEKISEVVNFKDFIMQDTATQQMFSIAPALMFSAYIAGNVVAEEEMRPVTIADSLKRVLADLGPAQGLPTLEELLEDTTGQTAMQLERILSPGVIMFLAGEIEKFDAVDNPSGGIH